RNPAVAAVSGEDSRSYDQGTVGHAREQGRGLAGQPGQLVLPGGDERDPHRTLVRGVMAQLAGKVAHLRVGQPRRHVGDAGQERAGAAAGGGGGAGGGRGAPGAGGGGRRGGAPGRPPLTAGVMAAARTTGVAAAAAAALVPAAPASASVPASGAALADLTAG